MTTEDDFDSISLDVEIEKINENLSAQVAERNRAEARSAGVRMCSTNQIKLLKKITFDLGLGQLSNERVRGLRRSSFDEVSTQIMILKVRLETAGALSDRVVVGNMASTKAVAYLLELRARAHNTPRGEERLTIWSASSVEIYQLTQQAMREVQDFNDRHGVPVPEWRVRRGL